MNTDLFDYGRANIHSRGSQTHAVCYGGRTNVLWSNSSPKPIVHLFSQERTANLSPILSDKEIFLIDGKTNRTYDHWLAHDLVPASVHVLNVASTDKDFMLSHFSVTRRTTDIYFTSEKIMWSYIWMGSCRKMSFPLTQHGWHNVANCRH